MAWIKNKKEFHLCSSVPYLWLILCICFSNVASACPYCADTIHNTDAQAASTLGGAMNLSIYCMFMGLFVSLGIVVRAVLKGIRN